MNNKNLLKPVPALICGALIISFSSILVKVSHVPPTISAFYRCLFGSLVLIIVCAIKKEFALKALKKNFMAIICGFLFSLDLWAWHLSIKYVGPGLATILGNFQVFILTFAGYVLFKEKISIKFIFAVPLAFTGLFAIVGLDIDHFGENYIAGIGFGLATALFYGMFLLLLRHLQSDDKDFSLFYYLMLLTMVCTFFLGLKAHVANESFVIPDLSTLAALISLGIFVQAIAWVMISNALPHVKASHGGLILLLQPTLAFTWDVLFFNRPTSVSSWAGVLIVIVAIYMGMGGRRNKT